MDFEEERDGCKVIPPYELHELADFANAVMNVLQENYPQDKIIYVRQGFGIRNSGQISRSDFLSSNVGVYTKINAKGQRTELGSFSFFNPTAPAKLRLSCVCSDTSEIVYGALEKLTEPEGIKV
jgi:hypothetical protein